MICCEKPRATRWEYVFTFGVFSYGLCCSCLFFLTLNYYVPKPLSLTYYWKSDDGNLIGLFSVSEVSCDVFSLSSLGVLFLLQIAVRCSVPVASRDFFFMSCFCFCDHGYIFDRLMCEKHTIGSSTIRSSTPRVRRKSMYFYLYCRYGKPYPQVQLVASRDI